MYSTPKRWKATPSLYTPENVRRIKTEQSIARAVLKRILAAGYSVAVYDGEETHPQTTSQRVAWSQMGETDEDRLYVYARDDDYDGYIGNILLIWGNDFDLVSDWAWNSGRADAEEIMRRLAGD